MFYFHMRRFGVMVFETFNLGYIIIGILINEFFYLQTKIENMKEEACQNHAKILSMMGSHLACQIIFQVRVMLMQLCIKVSSLSHS